MEHFEATAVPPADTGVRWLELTRTYGLSLGVYRVAVGADDPQEPHEQDEVYVVLSGHGRLTGPTSSVDARPGSMLVVPAGEPHQFTEVAEELVLAVVFGPPGSG